MNAHNIEKYVTIKISRHEKTGLMVAYSDDMKGLIVHGKTFNEINYRVPEAIKALLEAEGHSAVSVEPLESFEPEQMGFENLTMRFQLQEAA